MISRNFCGKIIVKVKSHYLYKVHDHFAFAKQFHEKKSGTFLTVKIASSPLAPFNLDLAELIPGPAISLCFLGSLLKFFLKSVYKFVGFFRLSLSGVFKITRPPDPPWPPYWGSPCPPVPPKNEIHLKKKKKE